MKYVVKCLSPLRAPAQPIPERWNECTTLVFTLNLNVSHFRIEFFFFFFAFDIVTSFFSRFHRLNSHLPLFTCCFQLKIVKLLYPTIPILFRRFKQFFPAQKVCLRNKSLTRKQPFSFEQQLLLSRISEKKPVICSRFCIHVQKVHFLHSLPSEF